MIETLADWNARLTQCGCCPMPGCPSVSLVCKSRTATVKAYGFTYFLPQEFDGEGEPLPLVDSGNICLTRVFTGLFTDAVIEESTHGEVPYNSLDYSLTVSSTDTYTYPQNFRLLVGCGEEPPTPAPVHTCDYSYASEATVRGVRSGEVTDLRTTVQTSSSVGGERTDEHIQWEADAAQWDLDNPDYEAELAAWQLAYDEFIDWQNNDGEPPGPDDPGPMPPARHEEPNEFYPPCTYRITTVETNLEEDPPVVVTTSEIVSQGTNISVDNYETSHEGCVTYADWTSTAETTARTALDFTVENEDCYGAACQAHHGDLAFSAEPKGVSMTAVKPRFRINPMVGSEAFLGTYFLITYDIAEFPDGWDAVIENPDGPEPPFVPDPAAPSRSFVAQDLTVEWTGPGTQIPVYENDPEDPPSEAELAAQQDAIEAAEATWLTTELPLIQSPEAHGSRRIVNIRYVCRRGTIYGVKPEVTGEALELGAAPEP